MTIITNRRSLILGATAGILSPSIVRASSLMQISGELLDPWVVMVGGDDTSVRPSYLNIIPGWRRISNAGLAEMNQAVGQYGDLIECQFVYSKARTSELATHHQLMLVPPTSSAPRAAYLAERRQRQIQAYRNGHKLWQGEPAKL